MPSILILSVGDDAFLLRIREQVLIKLGHSVKTIVGVADFPKEFRGGDYDLVLLCHSLATKQVGAITNFVRENRPSARLIGLMPLAEGTFGFFDSTSSTDPLLLNICILETMGKTP